jgi:hypothetical protein
MAQTGYTPISIYYSATTTNVPTAGNLVAGELAINTADGKLFYKDSSGVVQTIATKNGIAGGSNTQVQYNSSGSLAGSANMTFNGTSLTLANDASINSLTVGKGGGAISTNSAVGVNALATNSTGVYNSAFGASAGRTTLTGSQNTFIGVSAGYYSTADSNTSVGFSAYAANTTSSTGSNNTAIGTYSLYNNTSASNNTAVGYQASYSGTTVAQTSALGYQTLYSLNTGTNNGAVAIGYKAGYAYNTSSDAGASVFIGTNAGIAVTTGIDSTFIGGFAGKAVTTGSANTAIGSLALQANTTASNNTAVGYQAGYTQSTSSYNVYLGWQAGYGSTGSSNVVIGSNAGYGLTTGTNNTFVGCNTATAASGYAMTTGSKNTILGGFSGNQGGVDIRTASNYIVISDGDGNPRAYWDNAGSFNQVTNTTNYMFVVQNSHASNPYGMFISYTAASPNNTSNTLLWMADSSALRARFVSNGGLYNYSANNSNLSDIREKKDIQLAGNYLNKLCQIPVKTFLFNDQTDTDLNLGVIAQDVQAICPELVTESNWAKDGQEEKLRLSIYEADLKYAMLKAIQELKAEFDAYKATHP